AISFGLGALLGYWWVMHAFGDYSLAGNAAIKLDKLVLGEAHMYHGEGVAFDPEGILSTLPAIVNVLAGYLAGRFIRDRGTNGGTIVKLLLAGTACVVLSLWWNTVFPINKKLWTSSYVLCTVGIDLGVLAIIVYLVPPSARPPLDVLLRSVRPQHPGNLSPQRGRTEVAPDHAHRPAKPLRGAV